MIADYLRSVGRFTPAAKLFLFGQFLAGISGATLWVLRNLFLKASGMGDLEIGHTLSAAALGILVVGVPLSFFMDRGGLKWYLAAGVLAQGAGLLVTALWPAAGPVYLAAFVAGAGGTLVGVGTSPFYMRHSSPEERPYLFGVGNALGPLAALVGTGVIWILAKVIGEGVESQRQMIYVSAATAVVAAVVFLLIRDEAAPQPREERPEIDPPQALRLCLPEFLIGLGAGLTIPFINLYFSVRFGQGPARVSEVFSYAQVVTFFAFLAAPVFARRFGGVRTVVACQLLSIPFFLLMAFTMSPLLAIAAFLGRHALMNMAGPVASNFAMEVVPARQRALTNGIKTVAWNGAWAVSTSVGGWMMSHTRFVRDGFTVMMLLTIGLYLVGSLVYFCFWRNAPVMLPVGRPGPSIQPRPTPLE
jgi:MFS family permease